MPGPLTPEELASLQPKGSNSSSNSSSSNPLSIEDDDNPITRVKRVFQQAAEVAADEIVRISTNGDTDAIRFKASTYVVERVTGRIQDNPPALEKDPLMDMLYKHLRTDDTTREIAKNFLESNLSLSSEVKTDSEASSQVPVDPPKSERGLENGSQSAIHQSSVNVPASTLMPSSYLTDGSDSVTNSDDNDEGDY